MHNQGGHNISQSSALLVTHLQKCKLNSEDIRCTVMDLFYTTANRRLKNIFERGLTEWQG
jgi:hypothetical protein